MNISFNIKVNQQFWIYKRKYPCGNNQIITKPLITKPRDLELTRTEITNLSLSHIQVRSNSRQLFS